MTETPICMSYPGWRSRPRLSSLLLAGIVCWGFAISGCIAQQADLNRIKKDLDNQIIQIKKEKKELRDEVSKAREAIDEGKKQTAELQTENKKLFRFRAEMKNDFREFREKDFADFNGKIEEINKKLEDLQVEVKAENNQIGSRIQEVDSKMQAQQEELTALIQQVDRDGTTANQKLTEFQAALTTFKESLADLGNKFVQEAERDSRVETELSQQMGQNVQLSQATLDEIQTHLATNTANINEVSQSVTTIKEAIGQSGTLLGTRVDEEAARVTALETKQSQLEQDMLAITKKVNMETQALKTYFEQDVQSSMGTLQGDLAGLETQLVTQSNQIQELRQTALQLKEHQDVMGSLLGQRGDDLIQQAVRLDERMKLLESHQVSLDQTMESNRQNTTRHLDEITASLTSMNQALHKTTGDLSAQLTTQEQALNDLTQQIQALQAIKAELKDKQSQVQSVMQAHTEFRASVEQVTNRLRELENHQTAITTKIDSDFKAINSHLGAVNSAVASEKEALAQMNTQLNSRIDNQEQHLNKALTSFQSVEGLKKASQNNIAHLNLLTETVNKLRDVLTTIGKKFGERVDQHEERLAELAKRINQLQAKKVN